MTTRNPRTDLFGNRMDFAHQAENAARFHREPDEGDGGSVDAWESLARGNNLGKSVPIRFIGAGVGSSLAIASAEVLRIQSKGQREDIARQVCLTVSPPQVVDIASVPNPPPPSTQGNDALDLAVVNAVGPTGGFPVGPPSIANGFQFANAIVKVEWGVGSVKNAAFVDCKNGLTLNLITSWLIVTAFIEQGPTFTPSPAVYVIGANVGPTNGGVNNAQRSIVAGSLANAAQSAVFVVPRFARTARISAADGGNAPALPVGTIQFFADAALNIPVGDFAFNGNQTNPIPIPNGAYFWRIVSGFAPSAGGGSLFTAIFDLNI